MVNMLVMYIQFINLSSFFSLTFWPNYCMIITAITYIHINHAPRRYSQSLVLIHIIYEYQNYVKAEGYEFGSRFEWIRLLLCLDFKIRRIQRWSEQPDDPGSLCNTIMRKIISKIAQIYYRFTKK